MVDNAHWLSALDGVVDESPLDDDWPSALDGLDSDHCSAEAGQVQADDWRAQLDDISVASVDEDNMSVDSPQLALVEVPKVELHDITRVVHVSNCTPDEELDESAKTVAEYLMDNDPLTGRFTDSAMAVGEARSKCRGTMKLMSACALKVERNIWTHAEKLLVDASATSDRLQLIFYVEYASYDSTDFCLTSSQKVTETLVDGPALHGHDAGDGGELGQMPTIELDEATVGTKKILQMDTNVLLLLKTDGRYAILRGNMLSWLQ
ncbi:unnamed protein product, partial [Prorocentrum cordatum]